MNKVERIVIDFDRSKNDGIDHLEYHGIADSQEDEPVIYRTMKYQPELCRAYSFGPSRWVASPRVARIVTKVAPYIGTWNIQTRVVTSYKYDARRGKSRYNLQPDWYRQEPIISERIDTALEIPWLGIDTLPEFREFIKHHPKSIEIIANLDARLRLAFERHTSSQIKHYSITSDGPYLILAREAFDVLSHFIDPDHVTINEFHMTLPERTT